MYASSSCDLDCNLMMVECADSEKKKELLNAIHADFGDSYDFKNCDFLIIKNTFPSLQREQLHTTMYVARKSNIVVYVFDNNGDYCVNILVL